MKRVDGNGYSGNPGDFEWLDGTNVGNTYNNFAQGEPNNDPDEQDCGVFFTSDGYWKSELCEARYYVCQREAGKW